MVILLACASAPVDSPVVTEAAPAPPQMDAHRLLTRASLDLRGVRPSVAEYAAVDADPDALPGLLDGFVEDDRLGQRVVEIWAEPFRTRIEQFRSSGVAYGVEEGPWAAAIGEEPLRIVAHVVTEDRPFSEVVTADWTMANEALAAAWPVDYPSGGTGWQEVHYTDGRPAAGVLSASGLWWRYTSTAQNYNRGRANAASRILLCNDFLERPVTFERPSAGTEVSLEDQALSDPNCTTCHVSLDPLASYLGGFTWFSDEFVSPNYNTAGEMIWQDTTGVAPSYFGTPGDDLADLGEQMAADPRFVTCAVRTAYEGLLGRATTMDDTAALLGHRETFLQNDLHMKAVLRAMMDDPAYRAADDQTPGGVPVKLLHIEQLAFSVEAITGFHWTIDEAEMLGTDIRGLRVLGGGMDGDSVTHPIDQPNPTLVLVQQRLAELAASWAVENESPLFTVDLGDPQIDEATRRAEIASLTLQVLGRTVAVDSEEVLEADALWLSVKEAKSPPAAWMAVLTLLLRDPAMVVY